MHGDFIIIGSSIAIIIIIIIIIIISFFFNVTYSPFWHFNRLFTINFKDSF